jgi:mannan endo-1,4-beta-mannosidase
LSRGENRLVFYGKSAGFELDYVDLKPAEVAPPAKPPNELSDLEATKQARALFTYLHQQYGNATLAAQQELEDIDYVRSVTGKEPAVGAFDLMEYSPSRRERGADPKQLIERTLGWASRGPAIVSLSWHWNAPTHLFDQAGGKEWWRGFYTAATAFDLSAALADTRSEEYRLLLRDLDAIAEELAKYQEAQLPVLWRPLHEAAGGWFWWGAHGAHTFVKLWRLMFDRYVNHHGLHHLIWVYATSDRHIDETDWYPGDEYVDIVGVDVYTKPGSSTSAQWEGLQRLYGGRKLLAVTESGTPLDPHKARRYAARWSWFSIWSGRFVRKADQGLLKAMYLDADTLTRDELPGATLYEMPSP